MEQFEQLKLIYEQVFNTNDEIRNYLEKGLSNEAIQKSKHFEQLINQIKLSKKGSNLSESQKKELEELDKKILETITSTINHIQEEKNEIANQLKITKNKVKMNSAYTTQAPINGQILDESE